MSGDKDKKQDIEKIIQSDEIVRGKFNKEITSNTSDTTGGIPDFTTGDGDSFDGSDSGGSDSSDTESS